MLELVIAMVAAGAVSLMAGMLLLEGSAIVASATRRAWLADQSARAMEQMLRYIREIEQDAGLTGQAQISTAAVNELRFGAIGFRANGGNLEMTTDTAVTWHRCSPLLSSLTFRYYNLNGSELTAVPLSSTDRAAVRQVSIEIVMASGDQSHRLRTRAYLRNFMNEASA
jgi:hypothetical protein